MIINAERMFDGHTLTTDASVLIVGGLIVKVGRRGEFKGKAINTKFLLPGLIDMHMHLRTYAGSFSYANDVKLFDYFSKMLLYNGITTVRDVGSYVNSIYNFKNIKGYKPRIFSSIFLDGDSPIWSMSFVIRDEDQIREVINNYKASGIEWIKAYESIRPNVLKVIIREAHANGLKVAGDLLKTSSKEAIRMKIDTLEHIELLINGVNGRPSKSLKDIYKRWARTNVGSKEITGLVDYLARSTTAICPTLSLIEMSLFPSLKYAEYLKVLFPSNKIYKKRNVKTAFTKIDLVTRKRAFNNILKFAKKLNDAGISIVAGTDSTNAYVAPGFSLHQELKLMVASGIAPIDALKAATSEAAKVLGTNKIGQIRVGCKADLILLSEHADLNIANIDKITHVILNGTKIKVNLESLLLRSTLNRFVPEKVSH